MNVYNKKIKRVVASFERKNFDSYRECRDYVRSLRYPKKLSNWYSYLLWKQTNRTDKVIFDYHLKKVLQKKPLQKRLFKSSTAPVQL